MVVSDRIRNIMGGIETTGDLRLHDQHRKLKQRFDIVKKLGQGTYGKVQLGINKETGQEVAIKTIRKCKIQTEADLIRIRREIQIMSSVRHPNIIHIYEVFENREKMVLVMEYAAGGELYDYLNERKILTEDEARRLFRQIATAVYYCHKHKICHRDLKLENILLDEIGNAKIADFGLSNVFSYSSLLSTFCGSPLYASPEIVQGTPYVGPEVDCWSLGVLLYTLVYGAMPFDGSNFKRLVKQISLADYYEPKHPSSASALIADMLNVNPALRANIQSICSHRWINETYAEICVNVAEELARQTPVRFDLLLSLTTPVVNCENIAVEIEQAPNYKRASVQPKKPVRSQSLDDIPPSVVLSQIVPPLSSEIKALVTVLKNDNKSKMVQEGGCHSIARRKRSSNRSRESDGQEVADENTKSCLSEEQVSLSLSTEKKLESTTNDKPKSKSMECTKSKIFDPAEKLNVTSEKPRSDLLRNISSPVVNIHEAPAGLEKQISMMTDSGPGSLPPNESLPFCAIVPSDTPFLLTSTVALNKLAESVFHDEPEFHMFSLINKDQDEKIRKSPELMYNNSSIEANACKAVTLPRRKISRAEIHLTIPKSLNTDEKTNVNNAKCFTLLSTKRKQPDHNLSTQLDAADSLSSDEDDNFQLLTAENLFSTLLSRVRSLTRRLNKDEMKSSSFPSTLLTKNKLQFDNLPNRRSNDTRTFSRSEHAPWRRSAINNTNLVPRSEWSSQPCRLVTSTRPSLNRFIPSIVESGAFRFDRSVHATDSSGGSGTVSFHEPISTGLSPAIAAKTEARQKLSDILSKLGRSSLTPSKLNYSKSLPTNALQLAQRVPADTGTVEDSCNGPPSFCKFPYRDNGHATPSSCQLQSAGEAKPPMRRSRFLRPDFYDTPRENSKYVIQNETVRAFRERSLSRQRDLSRNRSHESFAVASPATNYRRSRTHLPAGCPTHIAASVATRPQRRRICGKDGTAEAESSDALRGIGGGTRDNDDSLECAKFSPAIGFRPARSTRLSSDGCGRSEDTTIRDGDSIGRTSRDHRLIASSASARKSALLQNELENEIRKTKNMNSKLNGLLVAMNDAESQYRYGREAAGSLHDAGQEAKLAVVVGRQRWPLSTVEQSATLSKADAPHFDRLSLLEKKLSYFRKLRNHDREENDDDDDDDDDDDGGGGGGGGGGEDDDDDGDEEEAAKAALTPRDVEKDAQAMGDVPAVATSERDTLSAARRSPAEEADSDALSALSDGAEYLVNEDVNDRIRRRSFYSRFNVYKQKYASNTAHRAKSSPPPPLPMPSPSYSG